MLTVYFQRNTNCFSGSTAKLYCHADSLQTMGNTEWFVVRWSFLILYQAVAKHLNVLTHSSFTTTLSPGCVTPTLPRRSRGLGRFHMPKVVELLECWVWGGGPFKLIPELTLLSSEEPELPCPVSLLSLLIPPSPSPSLSPTNVYQPAVWGESPALSSAGTHDVCAPIWPVSGRPCEFLSLQWEGGVGRHSTVRWAPHAGTVVEVTADADSGNVQGDNQEVMSLEYLLLFNMIFKLWVYIM